MNSISSEMLFFFALKIFILKCSYIIMIYLKKFITVTDANIQGNIGLDSPHVDYIVEKDYVNYFFDDYGTVFKCSYDENGKMILGEFILGTSKLGINKL